MEPGLPDEANLTLCREPTLSTSLKGNSMTEETGEAKLSRRQEPLVDIQNNLISDSDRGGRQTRL